MAAIVPHQGRQAIGAAIGRALYRYAQRLGQDAIDQLTEELTNNVLHEGRNALATLQETVQQFAGEHASQLGNAAFHITQGMRNAIGEVWASNAQAWSDLSTDIRGISRVDQPGTNRDNFGRENTGLTQNMDEITLDARGDISSESTMSSTSQPRATNGTTDVPMAEARMAATTSSSSGMGNQVSKETPISPYPSLSYGLQETHTTVLPWTGWVTVAEVDKTTPKQILLRMNSIYDIMPITTSTSPADGAVFPGKGNYYKMLRSDGKASALRYPESLTDNATISGCKPQWRDYWAQLYGWYTVLGCEYEIVLCNPLSGIGNDIVCGVQFDTYSDTATSAGNVMPLTNYAECLYFKNMEWHKIQPCAPATPNKNITVIKGTYKPGQAKRNIVNDGDVKTWTATGSAQPNLKELLTLNFWQDPLCFEELSGASHGVNCQINLKYIVQFKDLKQQARYPNTITTDQDITHILNEDPNAIGTAHHFTG